MRIVLLEPLGVGEPILQRLVSSLEREGHQVVTYSDRAVNNDELMTRSQKADGVMLVNQPYPDDVIRECPDLKMISVAFTGVDHVGMNSCREKHIIVSNAAGYSTHSVVELSFGLTIAVLRKMIPADGAARNGKTKDGLLGNELYGKTLGIVGTGAIGLQVAAIGKAFGCSVLAYSRSQKPEGIALGIQYVTLEDLLSQSDIVSLHVPLCGETKNLIDGRLIRFMKPSAILINTARGPVIDNNALAAALKNGEIGGAGIDVFEMEPPIPSTHPLMTAPNVILSPHIGFATREALERRAQIAFDNVLAWLKGAPQNVIL